MAKGVVIVLMTIFLMVGYFLVGVPAIEGVGESIKDQPKINSVMDGTGIIDSMYRALFQWIPLVFVGGMMVWAVAWYLRQESFTGRR